MATSRDPQAADTRERLLGAAELACAAWAVVGREVLGIFPQEIPIAVVVVLVGVRVGRAVFGVLPRSGA